MKQWQKEIKQAQLDREKQVYKELEGTYRQALDDVNKKAKDLQDQISKLVADDPENESLLRSKVYQLKYQEQIKAQLDDAMNRLNDAGSIEAYMEDMYKEGYASNIYALQKQGVPVIAPINHDKMLTALTYNTNNIPLSTRLYKNVEKTKKQVMSEITRGIASGMSNQDVARNIKNRMGVSYRKARQLAQNEGHRVNTQAVMDSMHDAKDRGADIVKQWDCTYDKKTRPVHARLDQKWTEIDDYFDYGGGKVFAPKQFGIASLDINCRCALLSVPRWDVDSDTPKHMDNITGELIEAKNYDDWKKKYYDVADDYDVKVEKPKESKKTTKQSVKPQKTSRNKDETGNVPVSQTYTSKDLDKMSLNELRQVAEQTASKYYSSGVSGISFGDADINKAAHDLAQRGSKTSLKKDIMSMQKKLKGKTKSANVPKPLFSQTDKEAITHYVSGDGMWINQYLRGRGDFGQLYDNEKLFLNDLTKAVDKPLPDGINKVYRSVDAKAIFGESFSDMDFERLENALLYGDDFDMNKIRGKLEKAKGSEITEKGFMSTSKSQEFAMNFGGFTGSDMPIVIEFDVPKGMKGADLKDFDIEGDEQYEVLFARNTKYKIQDIYNKDGLIYVKAKMIK